MSASEPAPAPAAPAAPPAQPWHETVLAGTAGPVVVAATLLTLHSLLFNFITDDAFISFVYSRNLARSGQLVFNLGERVEGYTNFLWTVILAGFYKLGLAPEAMSRILALLASFGTLYCVVRIAEHVAGKRSPAHAIAPVLLAGWGGFACWTSGGLETALFTFLCTLGIERYIFETLREPKPGWWWRRSSLWFAIASLTRPEGTLVFAAVGLHRIIWKAAAERSWRPRKDELGWIAMYLAIFAPYFAWRYLYYGWPFPNTYYIKSSGGAGTWGLGAYYLNAFAAQSRAPFAVLALGFSTISAALVPNRARRLLITLLPLVITVYLVYTAKVGGDFMGLFRFIMPTFPLLALLAQDGLLCLAAGLRQLGTPWPSLAAAGALLGIWWGSAMAAESHHALRFIGADNGIDSPGFLRKYTHDRATIGKWFHPRVSRDDYMSVGGAGAQPWYADVRALDAFGLSDEFIAHKVQAHQNRPGHQKWAPDDYVFRRRPTILCHLYKLEWGDPKQPLTSGPTREPYEVVRFAREGYYFVTVRIPGLAQLYNFAVLLTDRNAPLLHGAELERRISERLQLDDELVRVFDPAGT